MRKRARRTPAILCAAVAAVLAVHGTAAAHAYIERATPADGSAMSDPPAEVRLVYTEPVEPRLTTITLVGRDGRPVEGTRLESEGRLTLVLKLPPLAEGPYTVRSRVLGADGHVTEETVSFYVGTPPPDWKASAPAVAEGVRAKDDRTGVVVASVLLLLVLGVGVALIFRASRKPS